MNIGDIAELGPAGCYTKRWAVQGRGKKPYTVATKSTGEFGCSCPDWSKHFPRQDCKHIMRIKLQSLAQTIAPSMPAVIAVAAVSTGRKIRS